MQNLTAGLFLLFSMLNFQSSAQNEPAKFTVPTTNPRAVVQQKVAATTIEITYNRPSVRGRTIFGDLVPYGQIWRTGSDAATKISFSTPVSVEGLPIAAGTYEMFTLPGEKAWTFILQESRSQWGSYAYDPAFDVVRCTVTPTALCDPMENFTISMDEVTSHTATLNIAWEKVRVPVRIEIDLRATVLPDLEAALSAEERKPYFLAAMFYFENNLDIDRAAYLMQKAVEDNPNHIGMLYRLALILERKGDIAEAKAAAQRSLDGTADVGPELSAEYTRLNTALLERLNQK